MGSSTKVPHVTDFQNFESPIHFFKSPALSANCFPSSSSEHPTKTTTEYFSAALRSFLTCLEVSPKPRKHKFLGVKLVTTDFPWVNLTPPSCSDMYLAAVLAVSEVGPTKIIKPSKTVPDGLKLLGPLCCK